MNFKNWKSKLVVLQQMGNFILLYDEKADIVLTDGVEHKTKIVRLLHKFSKEILWLNTEPTSGRIFEFETPEKYHDFFVKYFFKPFKKDDL